MSNDSLFSDDPAPDTSSLFSNDPAPQTSGGNQSYSQPLPGAEPNNVGHTPPDVAMQQDMYGPGIKDATVGDAMAVQGAAGLGKMGAGLAAKGIGSALNAIPATENVLPTIDRIANNYTLKSFGGSPGQIQKMAAGRDGREALDVAARYARDKGLGDVWSTSIGREKTMEDLLKKTGEKVGDLRDEAGTGPKTSDLIKMAEDKFGPKYASGVDSGEHGEFKKALDEVSKLSPIKEIPQSEQIGSYLENYPESSSHPLNVTEPNPLYTDTPEYIHGSPLGPQRNPNFLSDQPTLSRTAEVPTNAYENARHSLEEFDAPDYDVQNKNPSNADIARTATKLNKYAADQSGMLRPNSATTDVSDLLSHENNADIAQKMGSDKAKQYVDALDEQSKLHPLDFLQKKGELREAGGRGSMFDKIKDKFGYRLTAQKIAALHDFLSGENLAKNAGNIPKNVAKASASGDITQKIHDYLIQERNKNQP